MGSEQWIMTRRRLLTGAAGAAALGAAIIARIETDDEDTKKPQLAPPVNLAPTPKPEGKIEIAPLPGPKDAEVRRSDVDNFQDFVNRYVNKQNDPDFWAGLSEFLSRPPEEVRTKVIKIDYGDSFDLIINWPNEAYKTDRTIYYISRRDTDGQAYVPGEDFRQLLINVTPEGKVNIDQYKPEREKIMFADPEPMKKVMNSFLNPLAFNVDRLFSPEYEIGGRLLFGGVAVSTNTAEFEAKLNRNGFMAITERGEPREKKPRPTVPTPTPQIW